MLPPCLKTALAVPGGGPACARPENSRTFFIAAGAFRALQGSTTPASNGSLSSSGFRYCHCVGNPQQGFGILRRGFHSGAKPYGTSRFKGILLGAGAFDENDCESQARPDYIKGHMPSCRVDLVHSRVHTVARHTFTCNGIRITTFLPWKCGLVSLVSARASVFSKK